MFVMVVVLLWSLAIIYIAIDFKNESNRWLSFTGFLGGFVGIYHTFEYLIDRSHYLRVSFGLISFISLCFPYPLLMYSLSINEFYPKLKRIWKNVIPLLFLIPVLVPFLRFNPVDFIRPMKYPIMLMITLWAVPYIIIADLYLIRSYRKETNLKLRLERLSACVLFIPTTIIILILSYILVTMGYLEAWRYVDWGLSFLLAIYFVIATRYGFFGFKLSFKKYSLDDTMKATSAGTSLLNHVIKNETLKISLCAENLKHHLRKMNENDDELQIIINSTAHMLDMMNRIREKTQEIVLVEEKSNLNEIIKNAFSISKPLLDSKKIKVYYNYTIKTVMLCDRVHIMEVICNIIKNSVEAMPENGRLLVNLSKTSNEVALAIQDNGAGISRENMSHVLEPFFSTKNRLFNYGLGLSYSYNVMKKHKGILDITSEENKGTLVLLKFPMSKVIFTETITDANLKTGAINGELDDYQAPGSHSKTRVS
jgi:signal transduction histidine kinase